MSSFIKVEQVQRVIQHLLESDNSGIERADQVNDMEENKAIHESLQVETCRA